MAKSGYLRWCFQNPIHTIQPAIRTMLKKSAANFSYRTAALRQCFILLKNISTRCRSLKICRSYSRGTFRWRRVGMTGTPPCEMIKDTMSSESQALSAVTYSAGRFQSNSFAGTLSCACPAVRHISAGYPRSSTGA